MFQFVVLYVFRAFFNDGASAAVRSGGGREYEHAGRERRRVSRVFRIIYTYI